MQRWHWSIFFTFLLLFLINTMPKCIGCKKDFNSQGFSTHKKSCKPYKRAIKAHLKNVPDLSSIPGPSNDSMVLEDAEEPGGAGDMFVDDVLVCNGRINEGKK